MDFKAEFHNQIAEIIKFTWLAQNAMTESTSLTPEVMVYVAELHHLSACLHGHVERWAFWTGDLARTQPKSRIQLLEYCIFHGPAIIVRDEIDGKVQSVAFDKLSRPQQAKWGVDRWWEEKCYPARQAVVPAVDPQS